MAKGKSLREKKYDYDIVILGGGSAGLVAAKLANGLGKKVALIEKRKLLGIHILGYGAAELMHGAQLVKSLGLSFKKVASVIHAYPSYSDSVRQPAKRCYIDILQNNFFIKLFNKIAPGKGKKRN